jgi:hypothetical protein
LQLLHNFVVYRNKAMLRIKGFAKKGVNVYNNGVNTEWLVIRNHLQNLALHIEMAQVNTCES